MTIKLEFNNFQKEKDDVLKKLETIDKSRKGSVDEDIKDLVNTINNHPNYYTTSSCSGRIMIIDKSGGKKHLAKWLLSSHYKIKKNDYDSIFNNEYLESDEFKKAKIWFMQEPAILHICAKDFESANKLLTKVREIPFKRSGIISISRRIIIEVLDTEKIETIIANKGILLPDEKYSKELVKEANNKLEKTKKKLEKLHQVIKKL
jgi:tRNA wybutosine-synthesizing protein 3